METEKSHFLAYLSRMRLIQRWGLMYNVHSENIQEHSLQVGAIAHILALIKNKHFGGNLDPNRIVVLAMYHDLSEVITGDLPTPIKYFSPEIKQAYKDIELVAHERLLKLLPATLQDEFQSIFFPIEEDKEHWEMVKIADKISAYLKCLEELKAANQEFSKASQQILKTIEASERPEVKYFMDAFVPSVLLTLDELE